MLHSLTESETILDQQFVMKNSPFAEFFVLISVTPLLVFPQQTVGLKRLSRRSCLRFSPHLLQVVGYFCYLTRINTTILVTLYCLDLGEVEW